MYEKVNPDHPDKVADRIAGAIVDIAYTKNDNPKIAVEVLLGHGNCHIIAETSEKITLNEVESIVRRISGDLAVDLHVVEQDIHLANNQAGKPKCGDNGIFKGMPITQEQSQGASLARQIYKMYPSDGKYIMDWKNDRVVICQSNAQTEDLKEIFPTAIINPLGEWSGGPDVDSGATNRKLGSDMGDAVTGGGLHGKDLTKADVSLNIYAHLKAQKTQEPVEMSCAIGDEMVDGIYYSDIIEVAREYITRLGGFEKLAEWGLI